MNALLEAAAVDDRICLVVGDLGYSVIERFAETFPKQFVNAGVSEQNMTALAAGMALTGKVVFTYSIANFSTLRPLEQIRNDVCYHQANVKVVSVGGGMAYGALGMTHHATEDLAIMRSLPNMTVVAPGDPVEARLATKALIATAGPAYLRLGKSGEPAVHTAEPAFSLGRAIEVRGGADLVLISTGGLLATAVEVARRLENQKLQVRVLSMHTVSPIDAQAVSAAATETRYVVTLEEHSTRGGLGAAVAEIMADLTLPHAPLLRLGIRPVFNTTAGDQNYLRSLHALDVDGISTSISNAWESAIGYVG